RPHPEQGSQTMATYTITVSSSSFTNVPASVQHGDTITFVPDTTNPPTASVTVSSNSGNATGVTDTSLFGVSPGQATPIGPANQYGLNVPYSVSISGQPISQNIPNRYNVSTLTPGRAQATINVAPWTITVSASSFTPATPTVHYGDTIAFVPDKAAPPTA